MANAFRIGKDFKLKLGSGFLQCESESSWEITNEGVLVRCKGTGDYGKRIAGGNKAGSITFSAVYDEDTADPNYGPVQLANAAGTIVTAVWGGTEAGDAIMTVDVQINSISMAAPLESEITFTGTLDFAGAPVFSTVST